MANGRDSFLPRPYEQPGIALFVDGFALQIHNIVVFKNIFTGTKVDCFNLALRAFDGFRNHTCLNRHIFRHISALHHGRHPIHAIAPEQAHEIIFQRQIELC